MWTESFKFIKLRRGRVITPSHGEIDFSRDDIQMETCKELFEKGFPYLELTEVGKRELYGIELVTEPVEAKPKRKKLELFYITKLTVNSTKLREHRYLNS